MEHPDIEPIIVRYLTQEATASDMDLLSEWLRDAGNEQRFDQYVKIHLQVTTLMNQPDVERIKNILLKQIRRERNPFYNRRARAVMKYAAVILLTLGLGYFLAQELLDPQAETTAPTVVDHQIETGSDKATLTLANGEQITLEKGQNYRTDHVRSDGEALTYREKTADNIAYNYLTIPRGGQYQIKLSDGTKVWLNSETRLKYPVAFVPGQTRAVELLHGEAYFEVSPSTEHNGTQFKVVHDQQDIEVLGTEFNVKAYQDEQHVYTTLVEGKIALEAPNTANERIILVPGQQADLSLEDDLLSLQSVKVYNAVSWKDGVFSFEKLPMRDIMRVLSRWYDMEVVFANQELEAVVLTGTFNKKLSIEELLTLIESTHFINGFSIDNMTVTIE